MQSRASTGYLKALGAILTAAALSACGNPYYPVGPRAQTLQLTGWVGNGAPLPIAAVHCYKTLARPDCYAEPQPRYASRHIASYVADW